MEKNWESLDVDDSDLPSLTLLRPCSILKKHSIPGPAGILQTSMNRKRLHHSDSPIPTHDLLAENVDDDFNSTAWRAAQHFTQSTTSVVIPTTHLADIDNTWPAGIVNQIVAIISSCTPNGLGDMMVTLKDRTGIKDGTIHRTVLTDSEFAKDISVKAAIILKKVSIFAPLSKTVYLNITRSNVVKVFRKDIAPLSGDTHVAPRVSYLPPVISKKPRMLEDTYTQEQGRTEETLLEVCQVANGGQSWLLNNQKRNGLSFPASGNSEISRDRNTSTQNEALQNRQGSAATEIYEEAGDSQETLERSEKRPANDNLPEGCKNNVFVGNLNGDHEGHEAEKAVKQRSISKVSLPQWTDEQLLELFPDDDPLF